MSVIHGSIFVLVPEYPVVSLSVVVIIRLHISHLSKACALGLSFDMGAGQRVEKKSSQIHSQTEQRVTHTHNRTLGRQMTGRVKSVKHFKIKQCGNVHKPYCKPLALARILVIYSPMTTAVC